MSDDGKLLWVGTDGGLVERDYETGRLKKIYTINDGIPDHRVTHLLSDGANGVWVGTYYGVTHLRSDKNLETKPCLKRR